MNGSNASFPSDTNKSHPYIERIKHIIRDDLGYRAKDILVLGAGGFTLSIGDVDNRYTYVDIDEDIRAVAEASFLHSSINGDFLASDARLYLASTVKRWDMVFIDVYSNLATIPWHLATLEFYRMVPQVLKKDGLVVINVVGDPRFRDSYTKNIDQTIRKALGRCVTSIDSYASQTNIIYLCNPISQEDEEFYSDRSSKVDIDTYLSSAYKNRS